LLTLDCSKSEYFDASDSLSQFNQATAAIQSAGPQANEISISDSSNANAEYSDDDEDGWPDMQILTADGIAGYHDSSGGSTNDMLSHDRSNKTHTNNVSKDRTALQIHSISGNSIDYNSNNSIDYNSNNIRNNHDNNDNNNGHRKHTYEWISSTRADMCLWIYNIPTEVSSSYALRAWLCARLAEYGQHRVLQCDEYNDWEICRNLRSLHRSVKFATIVYHKEMLDNLPEKAKLDSNSNSEGLAIVRQPAIVVFHSKKYIHSAIEALAWFMQVACAANVGFSDTNIQQIIRFNTMKNTPNTQK
jgi:hypothetical protein